MYIKLVKIFKEETTLQLNMLDLKAFKGKILGLRHMSAQIDKETAELTYGLCIRSEQIHECRYVAQARDFTISFPVSFSNLISM